MPILLIRETKNRACMEVVLARHYRSTVVMGEEPKRAGWTRTIAMDYPPAPGLQIVLENLRSDGKTFREQFRVDEVLYYPKTNTYGAVQWETINQDEWRATIEESPRPRLGWERLF